MLLPKFIFPKLTDISVDFLRKQKIRLLLMDFDNTMLPYIGEGSGMHARIVALRNLARAQAKLGQQRIDERALAYTRIAREQGRLA